MTYSADATDGLICDMQLFGGVLTGDYDYGMLTSVSCALTPKQTATTDFIVGWCLTNDITTAYSGDAYTGQGNCNVVYFSDTDTTTVATATLWSYGSIFGNEAAALDLSTDLTAATDATTWYFAEASVSSEVVTIPAFTTAATAVSATEWIY